MVSLKKLQKQRIIKLEGLLFEFADYVLDQNDNGRFYSTVDVNLNETAIKLNRVLFPAESTSEKRN